MSEAWPERQLGDLLSLEYGEALPATLRTGDGFPVFGSNGVVGYHAVALVSNPGIVVGRKGSAGEVSWAAQAFWPIDTTYYVASHGPVMRWLYWLLQFLPLQRMQSATGVPGLNRTDAYALRIPTPPLCEQQKIAEILDTVDEAIRKTDQIIAKLKQVKQGLLHDLLTRGIDDNGELRDPERHPEQFKDSPLGRIPKAWDVVALGTIAEVDRGKFTHRPRNDPKLYGGPYPFIQTGDIAAADGGKLSVASQSLNAAGISVSRQFPVGTIAVTIAANIADTAILQIPMYFPDSVVGVVVHPPNVVRYVQLCIQRAKRALDACAPASAQKNINLQDLRPLRIPRPMPDEQEHLAERYEGVVAALAIEHENHSKLRLLKAGLMEDLLTGRVRTTNLLEPTP